MPGSQAISKARAVLKCIYLRNATTSRWHRGAIHHTHVRAVSFLDVSEHVTVALSEYLDDELSTADRSIVDAHVRACDACAAMLGDFRWIVEAARRAAARGIPPSRDLWPAILARIQR
jgi:hypothetical protein